MNTLNLATKMHKKLKNCKEKTQLTFCVSCLPRVALNRFWSVAKWGAFSWLFFLTANSAFAYSGGNGEPNTPYQIADVNNLLELRADVNNYDKFFVLTADINLAGYDFNTAVIAPYDYNSYIGELKGTPFTGVFDGACHKISNLRINGGDYTGYLGLFSYVEDGAIINLGLEDVNIMAGRYSCTIGGLVGFLWSTGAGNGGKCSNCYSKGVVSVGVNPGGIGGLVGSNWGDINNCYSKGAVFAAGGDNSHIPCYGFGGLVGANGGIDLVSIESGYISNSWSSCDVNCGVMLGGIGGLAGMANGNVSNCYATGTVSGGTYSWDLGGLVGVNGGGNINTSFSTGPVIGQGNSLNYLGGLVGLCEGNISNCYSSGDVNGGTGSSYVGGLLGLVDSYSIVSNCYSVGDVNGGGDVGGLIGAFYGGVINSCYFLEGSGPGNGYGTPLADSQMKQQASFVGWDFVGETINGTEDIWWILENITYPKLNWQRIIPPNPCGLGGPGGHGGPDDGGIYFPDYNFDNFVNFLDFAIFANAWLTENPFISLDDDSDVDINDLKIFCDYWLTYTNNIDY